MCLHKSVYEPSSDEHKHHWPRTGADCYCGAKQCEYMTPRAPADVKPQRIRPYRGSVAAVKADRCTEATLAPTPYCEVHKGIVELKRA